MVAARRRGRAAALAMAMVAMAAGVVRGTAAEAAAAGPARGRALLGERDHKYKKGEEVKLYANKVGPFHNPR